MEPLKTSYNRYIGADNLMRGAPFECRSYRRFEQRLDSGLLVVPHEHGTIVKAQFTQLQGVDRRSSDGAVLAALDHVHQLV